MSEGDLARVMAQHGQDPVVWLCTVTAHGRPTVRPVWFVVDGGAFVVFSAPGTAKVAHVRGNPQVTLTFHTDSAARSVRVVDGLAAIDSHGPAASETPGFLDKYEHLYAGLGYDRAGFDVALSMRLTVVPTSTWGW
ncbi:Pyridoxamine 5'-phosphate oxidase [Prauserella sp. Am3]|nr:Pyridoxamine 5'-phosphate oxidase [Prauserella sp. Am3]